MASSRREVVLTALGALAWRGAGAADESAVLKTELISAGFYLISGGGGNSLLRFSANGLVLVNGKSQGSYKPLMSQVRRINKLSDMPLRALILTNAEEPQAANSAQFAAAKVVVLAQANAAAQLTESAAALVTFDRDYALRIGGVELQLKYFGPARTDADTLVFFPDKRILAVGGLFCPDEIPPAASLPGWSQALALALELDFDQAIPNQGPAISRAELQAFRRRIDA